MKTRNQGRIRPNSSANSTASNVSTKVSFELTTCGRLAWFGFRIDILWETCCMVGRDCGLASTQTNSSFATLTNSSVTRLLGVRRRWSDTSLKRIWWPVDTDMEEMRSPGCLPIITSKCYHSEAINVAFLICFRYVGKLCQGNKLITLYGIWLTYQVITQYGKKGTWT